MKFTRTSYQQGYLITGNRGRPGRMSGFISGVNQMQTENDGKGS